MKKNDELIRLIELRNKLEMEIDGTEIAIGNYLNEKLGFDEDVMFYDIYITNNPTGELLSNGEYYRENSFTNADTHYYPIEDSDEYVGIDYLKNKARAS